ncbi:RNA 2',3'-cyclic phosphodiesterase [Marichromatium gracile]|uniref:RNA 2',3'-cyclic phosphodiesterase n=1 Tax=Marichromatium gracile TaxID=1048 RepID=A0A4R4ADK3_MARGR|nr:RNA 2',3'-cyclic phosphodiesterase [Marichromatium gracile]MBK1709448.1 RNA 2',3'-cyclic phosphodiesterase [Marichromatium gracile]TCW36964.1 2'-5' RNA ligase [Marichromatium gracile]
MAERWFFALWPEPALRRALLGRMPCWLPPGGRATHGEDLHLTLVFLGALTPPQLDAVNAAAQQVAAAPFELVLDRLGHFARAGAAWCAPQRVPESLLALQLALVEAQCACGLTPEQRSYRPHLTLARRSTAPRAAFGAPLRWPVREFVLARSVPGCVPRYRVERRWSLRPGYDLSMPPMR